MDFKVPGRMNLFDLLQQMAFWNRCAMSFRNDVFHLTYLSDEPLQDGSIIESDVAKSSMEITHSNSDDLVTKFIAEWKPRCSLEDPYKYVLRYNVRRYGTQEETFDCFVFRHQTLVDKSAKFWLLRMANTWRKVKVTVPVSKLALESLDGVWITLPDVGDGVIKCRVETAVYDSANNTINMTLWTPIRSGSRIPYDFAYPAAISTSLLHPTKDDLQFGNAGGSGPGVDVTPPGQHVLGGGGSSLPQGFGFDQSNPCGNISTNNLGGPSLAFRCRPDMGDSQPSDIDDQKPSDTDTQDDNASIPDTQSPKQEVTIGQYLDLQSQNDENEGGSSQNGNEDTRQQDRDDEAGTKDPNDSNEQRDLAEELPTEDDLEDDNICHWWVQVWSIKVKTVRVDEGQPCGNDTCVNANGWCHCSESGAFGCVTGNVTAHQAERYSFGTVEARDRMFESLEAIIDAPDTVGNFHPMALTKGVYNPSGCIVQDEGDDYIGYSYKGTQGQHDDGDTVLGWQSSPTSENETGFGQEGWTPPSECQTGSAGAPP
jgi:hypothetical protein